MTENAPPPGWAHAPDLPIETSPLWSWPPRPMAALRWHVGAWAPITVTLLVFALSLAVWRFATPDPVGWGGAFLILLRNLLIFTAVAGGLHWWLYGKRAQGAALKYDPRDLGAGRRFAFGSQLWDNVAWSLGSGVVVWSAYEAFMLYALGRGWVTPLDAGAQPILFAAIFLAVPLWESFWFYWIHRALHWPPLYRLAHAVHHRNDNIGPWSGLSMHPVEHVMYFGSVLIHFAISSHPVHVICHLMFYGLYAITTHTGFEGLLFKNKKRLHLGNFHHQIHHRYFECNYGTLDVPWDILFGSWHDGTEAGKTKMRDRLKARASMRR